MILIGTKIFSKKKSDIPGRVRPKDFKRWYSQLSCLTFSI